MNSTKISLFKSVNSRKNKLKYKSFINSLKKSVISFLFCLQVIRNFDSIDHLRINPIRRIGLIHK